MLVGIAFMASCSKESKPETTAGKKGKKMVVKPVSVPLDAKNTLNATRRGQNVKLTWQIDMSGGKPAQLSVVRSASGTSKTKSVVADLGLNATSYEDSLPNENACWYWIRVRMEDGKAREIGPVRVEADKIGSSNYAKPEDKYQVSITRTDDLATLKWDFPEETYREIKIVRATRPTSQAFKGTGLSTPVTTTVEGKSQNVNALPDANSEYWYWFRITLKSGAIIYKGPVKAEFPKRIALPKAKSKQ